MAASSSSSAPASSRRKCPCSLNCSAFETRPAATHLPPLPPLPHASPPPPPLPPLIPIPGFHPQEKIHEETIQSAGLDAGHCLPGRLGHLDRMGATDARQ